MIEAENAVVVRNASKTYGRGKKSKMVLDKMNMTVTRGSIYGLLGASGCGKTTILSCIAGRHKLDEGDITVLGGVPGTKGSGVPGPRIGYMPQEMALVNEMSVRNMIYYFGWLFGMSNSQIEVQFQFLSKLLELPPEGRLIRDLSGGQQRRVSFAAALVQTPELLILDEPTVGLDPVLRQSIWDYLVQISTESDMTIIITTHYIEEATQAHKVGLLREGTLLADTAPDLLIAQYNCSTLEEVFLILSRKQGTTREDQEEGIASSNLPLESVQQLQIASHEEAVQHFVDPETPERRNSVAFDEIKRLTERRKTAHVIRPESTFGTRMKALLYKDLLAIFRNYAGLSFLFLVPAIEMSLFFLAIGNDSTDLHLGIVNDEHRNCDELIGDVTHNHGVHLDPNETAEAWDRCHFFGLSCLLLDKLNDGTTVNVMFDDTETALVASKRAQTIGTIHIPGNFSQLFEDRYRDGTSTEDDVLERSVIKIWMDMSNYLQGYQVKKHIYEKYDDLANDIAIGCNLNTRELHLPIRFNDPVYGTKNPSYRMMMAPGLIITMAFFLASLLTALTLANERSNGMWDRNLVSGVKLTEVVLSHTVSQTLCTIIQIGMIVLMTFVIFALPNNGSMVLVISLTLLQSLAGVVFGLMISAFSKNTTEAMYYTLGSFLPSTFIVGMVWPLEGAPYLLQVISYCTPNTWATRAIMNIVSRGWGILHPHVYYGFLATVAWIVAEFGVIILLLNK